MRFSRSAILILVVLLAACISAKKKKKFNFCKVKVPGKPDAKNTMCLFKPTDIAATCGAKYTILKPSAAEQETILKLHNDLRTKVAQGQEIRGLNGQPQPAAADMRKLIWDKDLADMAQTHAQQCVLKHDENRGTKKFKKGAGQNIAMSLIFPGRQTSANWDSAINSWYNQVDFMNPLHVDKIPDDIPTMDSIKYYTQVVWAKTSAIGCGAVEFVQPDGYSAEFIVCNYGVAGNIGGPKSEPVYTRGPAASACPKKTKPRSGLCA